jgi:hypothetical protein
MARELAWGVWEYGKIVNLDAETEVRVYIVRDGTAEER